MTVPASSLPPAAPRVPGFLLPVAAAGAVMAGAVALTELAGGPFSYTALPALGAFAVVVGLMVWFHRRLGSLGPFGAANAVTLGRGLIAAWLAGLICTGPEIGIVGWWIAGAAFLALLLDGIDGWLARWQRTVSAFGARFDMEVDALLLLVLSLLAWEAGRAGPWVLLIGLMRYGFVATAYALPWMDAPLPPRFRRKAVCVAQGLALALVFVPPVPDAVAATLAAGALGLLALSFAGDVGWLIRNRPGRQPGRRMA
ncbi:CDP-alcohol phosphatidyltransferase family protein [Inquilinus sp. CAU 1745]|uniref:CDP-alcohol phosphatidyltransferase family protein n=1 Tax=Inquilinus sp. CAU 1745 TaxID=3140369 RepID=UPI00325B3B3F